MTNNLEQLIQDVCDGRLTRREFIQRAAILTGSVAAATMLFESSFPALSYSAQVDPNDPALVSETIQFPGRLGNVFGYQSRPKASGRYSAIIVVHENRGLNDHIRDVARRFAKSGFGALAVDYLSRQGGTEKVPVGESGIGNIRELVTPEVIKDETEAAVAHLKTLKEVRGDRIGIVGFCWGGGTAFYAATQVPALRALVVFYGSTPGPVDLILRLEAQVLAHYGELDKRITGGAVETEAAMKRYNKSFEYKIYPGAQHAFHNDTRPSYHPEAAKEAWNRTVEFFKKHLQS
jgi:carboxymethylenebutenolidase